MMRIHPTAVIDPRAQIGEDVTIGPYCVVDGPVRIGRGCVLHAFVTLLGDTELGEGNRIFPGAVLGAEPQDLKHEGGAVTRLAIGSGNRFREHVTVHPGTVGGGGVTTIGSGGLFMVGCHVAHDCQVGDYVILANHVLLAGHVRVGDRAVMNGASACHHFTTVGRLAYVGGLSRITQDVHPFTVVEGHPARVRAANTVGMQRAGLAEDRIQLVKRAVYAIFLSGKENSAMAVSRLEVEHADESLVQELIASIHAAEQGRQGRAAEATRRIQ
ncbi:MAG: acyl-ACP--UDP-N-acetylglucosamine O-acyltransferase [Planctomycetota bacterium]